MKGSILFAASLAIGLTTAAGCPMNLDNHPWKAPGAGDRRSPCPGLNALANHGYLPRDGFNISAEQYFKAADEGINFSRDALENLVKMGLSLSTTGNNNTFHLDDINKHNAIEHDSSLSRNDAFFGDNHSFNPTIWNSTRAWFTEPIIGLEHAARAVVQRLVAAKASNPGFGLTKEQEGLAVGATALYMSALGDKVNGTVRRDYVRAFFEEERLPAAEGWCRAEEPVKSSDIGALFNKLNAARPAPIGCS
ncbi:hypothetical protein RB595_000227 [Gaeumannomyces hyphopodioides]